MHDAMQYDLILGQGHEPLKVGNPSIFKSYLVHHLQWELATDHGFLNYGTISKFSRARFVIFVLVFVSRDLELSRYVSCEEELTVSTRANFLMFVFVLYYIMLQIHVSFCYVRFNFAFVLLDSFSVLSQ